jgi:hypothetical protein
MVELVRPQQLTETKAEVAEVEPAPLEPMGQVPLAVQEALERQVLSRARQSLTVVEAVAADTTDRLGPVVQAVAVLEQHQVLARLELQTQAAAVVGVTLQAAPAALVLSLFVLHAP